MKRTASFALVLVLLLLAGFCWPGVPASAGEIAEETEEILEKCCDVNGYRYYLKIFTSDSYVVTDNGLKVTDPEKDDPTDLVDGENVSHLGNMPPLYDQVMSGERDPGRLLCIGLGSYGVAYDKYFGLHNTGDFGGDIGSPDNYYISRIEKLVTQITLGADAIELTVGEAVNITTGLSVSPEDAANKELTWSCEDEEVATIDENGTLTATGAGITTLTVTAAAGNASVTCPVTVKAVVYEILEGAGGKYSGEKAGLRFRGSGDFAKFCSVKVNGETIGEESCTVSEGSTVVELKSEYLDTLESGTHTLEILWSDGSAKTDFVIEPPGTEDDSGLPGNEDDAELPETGDESGLPGTGDDSEPPEKEDDSELPETGDDSAQPETRDYSEPPKTGENSEVPKTGDDSAPFLYAGLMLLCIAGLTAMLAAGRINKN